jgi:hypothetical protein
LQKNLTFWKRQKKMQNRGFKNFTATWQHGNEVQFFKDGKFQYSKFKNDDHTKNDLFMLLEWFEVDNKTVFIFNEKHGLISTFDAETGELIHTTENDDVFIYNYEMFDNNEYLYISGLFWSSFPVRIIFHVPTMLTTPDYTGLSISCDDCKSNYDVPDITLFGCETCKQFIDMQEIIFEKLNREKVIKTFNKNRSDDILLRRFLESKHVVFADHSRDILMKMLENDRSEFYISCFGGNSHEHLTNYDYSLFSKVAYKTLNQDTLTNSKLDPFSFLIASTLFNFIASLPFSEINLHFSLISDIGNLSIRITHVLVEDINFKLDLIKSGWTEEKINEFGTRYKINIEKPIQVEIFLKE